MSNPTTSYLTNIGQQELTEAVGGTALKITSAAFGSDLLTNTTQTYMESLTNTVTNGSPGTVYVATGTQIQYNYVTANQIQFRVTLGSNIGTFNIGNWGLLDSNNSLISITSLGAVDTKTASSSSAAGDNRVYAINITFNEDVVSNLDLSVISLSGASIPEVASVTALPAPANASYPVFHVQSYQTTGYPALSSRINNSTVSSWYYYLPFAYTDGLYVHKVGDTMTGQLTINPSSGLSLVTNTNAQLNSVEIGTKSPALGQGSYITWNNQNSNIGFNGETDFINFKGLGAGGFCWINSTSQNYSTASSANMTVLATLDSSGNLGLNGNVYLNGTNGIRFGSNTQTSTWLNFNTSSYTITVNGNFASTGLSTFSGGQGNNLKVTNAPVAPTSSTVGNDVPNTWWVNYYYVSDTTWSQYINQPVLKSSSPTFANVASAGIVSANGSMTTPTINVNEIDGYDGGGNLKINNNVEISGNFTLSDASSSYVPTPATGNYSNLIADTAFVQNALVAGTGLGFYKGKPGYSVLPGGMIIQSGISSSGSQGGQTVTFPVAFPSTCISVLVCEGAAEPTWGENGGQPTVHGIANGGGQYNFQTYSMRWTGSGFTGQSGLTFMWIAFGY